MNENKWIQLVVVRLSDDDAFLFRAPRFSCKPGDEVEVATRRGQARGRVLFTDDFALPDRWKDVERIVKAFGAQWPICPVVSRLAVTDMKFDDSDWNVGDELPAEE